MTAGKRFKRGTLAAILVAGGVGGAIKLVKYGISKGLAQHDLYTSNIQPVMKWVYENTLNTSPGQFIEELFYTGLATIGTIAITKMVGNYTARGRD